MYILLILGFCLSVASCNKYSENVNAETMVKKEHESPFRMKRINLVWQKAKKRLTSEELLNLQRDLEVHDKLELNLKHRKKDGLDDDGEYEALVRKKFISLLKQYGLVGVVDHPSANALPVNESKVDVDKLDKKLAKVWRKAQMAGFSDDELSKLSEELGHHQEKMDEYNMLKNEISQFGGENSVPKLQNKEETMAYKHKKKGLKEKFNNLKDNYEYLESYLSREPNEEIHFNQPRVIDLWLLAKKANFTETELKSFKEELHHFEKKLEKKDYMQRELNKQSAKKEMVENNPEVNQRYAHFDKKVKEYDRKIKKFHTDLKTRVVAAMNSHNEL